MSDFTAVFFLAQNRNLYMLGEILAKNDNFTLFCRDANISWEFVNYLKQHKISSGNSIRVVEYWLEKRCPTLLDLSVALATCSDTTEIRGLISDFIDYERAKSANNDPDRIGYFSRPAGMDHYPDAQSENGNGGGANIVGTRNFSLGIRSPIPAPRSINSPQPDEDWEIKLKTISPSEFVEMYAEKKEHENNKDDDSTICVICMDNEREIALTPCGHRCLCPGCAQLLKTNLCPVCQTEIASKIKIFL